MDLWLMLEFSKNQLLFHEALLDKAWCGSSDEWAQAKWLGWASASLSFTITLVLVLIGSVTEACNKPLQLIAKR